MIEITKSSRFLIPFSFAFSLTASDVNYSTEPKMFFEIGLSKLLYVIYQILKASVSWAYLSFRWRD